MRFFQHPHREYVTLTGGKTKPEDRDKRDDFPDLVFDYNKETDSYTCPRGKVKNLVFKKRSKLKGVPYRHYWQNTNACLVLSFKRILC